MVAWCVVHGAATSQSQQADGALCRLSSDESLPLQPLALPRCTPLYTYVSTLNVEKHNVSGPGSGRAGPTVSEEGCHLLLASAGLRSSGRYVH